MLAFQSEGVGELEPAGEKEPLKGLRLENSSEQSRPVYLFALFLEMGKTGRTDSGTVGESQFRPESGL